MADLEAYRDKFGESGQRVLQNALNESRLRGQNYVGVEHIISALAKSEPELFDSTMRALSLDPEMVTQAINSRLESARQHVGKGFRIAPETCGTCHPGLVQSSRSLTACSSRCCETWVSHQKPSSSRFVQAWTRARAVTKSTERSPGALLPLDSIGRKRWLRRRAPYLFAIR